MFINRKKWIDFTDRIRDLEYEKDRCDKIMYKYFETYDYSPGKIDLQRVITDILNKLNMEYRHISEDHELKERIKK